jgi:4-aminobutyrate aminotransferase-like enzyme
MLLESPGTMIREPSAPAQNEGTRLGEVESALASALLSYLDQHPRATDTITGIGKFWLGNDTATPSQETLRKVINNLVERGLLCRRQKPDGESIYLRDSTSDESGR